MNTSNQSSVQHEIEERNRIFAAAMLEGNATGIADCYTQDAEFMAPGADSICGRSNIRDTMQGYIDQGFTQYEVTFTKVYGSEGVIGVQAAYTLGKENHTDQDSGKSVQLWKKENGVWKIYRDCFNSNLPDPS